MSLRLVILIIACGMALAHNMDGLDDQKADSAFRKDTTPPQYQSMHRRESPEAAADGVLCGTDSLTAEKTTDTSHHAGSQHAHKRSPNLQPENVAGPGCCG